MSLQKIIHQALEKERRGDFLSPSQVRNILIQCLTSDNPQHALDLLDQNGFLKKWMPEVVALKGVQQKHDWHGDNDAYAHTRKIFEFLKCPSEEMALSVLLHDVGKAVDMANHPAVGAEMARKRLEQLEFPEELIKKVTSNVANHMIFDEALQKTPEEVENLFSRPNVDVEIELYRLDLLGCEGPVAKKKLKNGVPQNYAFFKEKLDRFKGKTK